MVAIPTSDFNSGVKHDNRVILLISLGILVVSVTALVISTLVLSNRIAAAKVRIHDVQEKDVGIDLNSGMEKALDSLESISASADKYMKERIKGVINQLVGHVNSGGLFTPTLQEEQLDGVTMEWLQVELGQEKAKLPRSSLAMIPSCNISYYYISNTGSKKCKLS